MYGQIQIYARKGGILILSAFASWEANIQVLGGMYNLVAQIIEGLDK